MGKLTKSHMIETAVWLLIAGIFFGFTFEFNQPIEIYIFGATGWPRVVIGLMLIVTFGNFYHHLKYGSTIQAGRVGIADDEAGSYDNLAAVIKVLAVLGTPFLFALSLKPVGLLCDTFFHCSDYCYFWGATLEMDAMYYRFNLWLIAWSFHGYFKRAPSAGKHLTFL